MPWFASVISTVVFYSQALHRRTYFSWIRATCFLQPFIVFVLFICKKWNKFPRNKYFWCTAVCRVYIGGCQTKCHWSLGVMSYMSRMSRLSMWAKEKHHLVIGMSDVSWWYYDRRSFCRFGWVENNLNTFFSVVLDENLGIGSMFENFRENSSSLYLKKIVFLLNEILNLFFLFYDGISRSDCTTVNESFLLTP